MLQRTDLPPTIDQIPTSWLSTPYVYDRYPGVATFEDPTQGANCQLFAYAVLGLYGWYAPPLRSSNLWEDTTFTQIVDEPRSLDIAFFNRDHTTYGAHIGLVAREDQILHLSKQIGTPALWEVAEFQEQPQYQTLIGFKRCLRTMVQMASES